MDAEERDKRAVVVHGIRQSGTGLAQLANELSDQLDAADFYQRAADATGIAKAVVKALVPAAEKTQKPKRLGELLEGVFKRFNARVTGDEMPVPLPWPSLSALYGGGFWPGVHILGGGTGVGKTAFVMQLALYAAREGVPVLYIGLEMGEMDAVARCVALLDEASPDVYASELMHGKWAKNGGVNPGRLGRLEGIATNELGDLPFELELGDAHGWSYDQLVPRVADLRERYKVAAGKPVLVVLDFLQLVDSPSGRREEMRERITRASYQARAVVTNHDAAVLMVSSTSRENERLLRLWGEGWPAEPVSVTIGKSSQELTCTSFIGIGKESGDIEYSAESLTVLARVGSGPGKTTRVRIGAPKVRYGEPGRATTLLFNGSRWLDDEDNDEKRAAAAAAQAATEKADEDKRQKADAAKRKRAEDAAAAAEAAADRAEAAVPLAKANKRTEAEEKAKNLRAKAKQLRAAAGGKPKGNAAADKAAGGDDLEREFEELMRTP